MQSRRNNPRRMQRTGFTVIELLIALVLMGAVAAIGIPRVKESMLHEAVRNARREVTAELARARSVAASRGCRSGLHVAPGTSARVWVTACQIAGGGLDTVGAVEHLSDRFGVSMTSSGELIEFAPNGLAIGSNWTVMSFTKLTYTDSLAVSPLGKARW